MTGVVLLLVVATALYAVYSYIQGKRAYERFRRAFYGHLYRNLAACPRGDLTCAYSVHRCHAVAIRDVQLGAPLNVLTVCYPGGADAD